MYGIIQYFVFVKEKSITVAQLQLGLCIFIITHAGTVFTLVT